MITSEKTDELTKALMSFQKALVQPRKDATNPYYKSAYADLATVWAACSEPLAANGLAFTQTITTDDDAGTITWKEPIKEDKKVVGERDVLGLWLIITSRLMHASEQYLQSHIRMPVEADPQSLGKVTTYIRRYSMMAMLGIAPEDDDGNAAAERRPAVPHTATPPAERKPCPLHKGQFLVKHTSEKGSWWSHKLPDGSYCNERKDTAKEAPQPQPAASQPQGGGNAEASAELFPADGVKPWNFKTMDETQFKAFCRVHDLSTVKAVCERLGVASWAVVAEMGFGNAASRIADMAANQ